MLTKSLHTITAATNVARFLCNDKPGHYNDARHLADSALYVLFPAGNPDVTDTFGDDTVQRIVANCAKLLAERSESNAQPHCALAPRRADAAR